MNIFKVFKRESALKLIAKGNNLIYTEPNRNKNWLVVFCFEDTTKLRQDFTNLSNNI